MLVGTAAGLFLLSLTLTSTRGWQKRLGKNWKRLHRLAYLAGILAVVHFLWLVKDVREPLRYAALLALLLALRLPPVRRLVSRARQRLTAALRRHHDQPEERLENAYLAMCVWDEAMAESIVRHLESAAGRDRRMIVLVGSGHVRRRFGIPDRVTRRTGWRQLVIVPEEIPADAKEVDWRALVTGDAGDYLFLTPLPAGGER